MCQHRRGYWLKAGASVLSDTRENKAAFFFFFFPPPSSLWLVLLLLYIRWLLSNFMVKSRRKPVVLSVFSAARFFFVPTKHPPCFVDGQEAVTSWLLKALFVDCLFIAILSSAGFIWQPFETVAVALTSALLAFRRGSLLVWALSGCDYYFVFFAETSKAKKNI